MASELIAILDTSSSMASLAAAARDGFNGFVSEQASVPGEARLTLVTFDSVVTTHYTARPLDSVDKMHTYRTHGMTAMNDAIGIALTENARRIKALSDVDNVTVCIITDGQENASKKYSQPQVRELVSHCKEYGWTFIFLAANIDAHATGMNYGFDAATTYSFSASNAGMTDAYSQMSRATMASRMIP